MQRAFLPSFLLLSALAAGLNEARAARLVAPATVQDTIVMRLPNRATLTLTVRDAAQLRQLKNYHLDSLTTRLATYITQAEAAAKAGTTNQVTMRFYPDKDQPGQNLPEEIRITAHKPGTDGEKGPTKTQVFLNKKFGIVTTKDGDGHNSFSIGTDGNATANAREDSLKREKRRRSASVELGFDIGLTTLVNSSSTASLQVPSYNNWRSTYINFGLFYVQPLHYTKKSKLAFTIGPEFSGNYIRLTGNDQWVQNGNRTFVETAPDAKQIQQATLYVGTLNLPVMLRLKLKNKEDRTTLSAGIGGFGGTRLTSNIKTEYRLAGTDYNSEDKISGTLNLTPWTYGLQGEIGFHALQLFAKYNMNELFKEGQGPKTHLLTVGLNVLGF
ncbi:PorT family protein [Hymenobacter sp. 5317J-9]|uniref:PorT family protein n=1 Tax=Hymenobacter sp. 5317J-9 TaxID=2932250 RepID=UPI001FD68266|nr:PorT family protein [Hymenobacter sp. 5317J-9]UOQ95996.1 PorT family protein [Hymenobacter sp. 5317J-9]